MAEVKKEKMATRQAYGKTLVEIGAENKNLVVMDADLSKSTMTAEFAKAYPDRFFNMGIAEQDLYAAACGLALSGKVVCASTFAMFAAGRAFEIIRNSIGYTHANVKVCATHAGITVGEDGASHQTFEDIALMRTIPGMVVVNPSDGASAKALLKQVIEMNGPAYVRLGRAAVPMFYDEAAASELKLGRGSCLREGKDLTIIATGIMVNEAMIAAEELAAKGIDARVIDMHTIKPLDEDIIVKAASETGAIVTAEEHSVIGGLGSAVAEVVVKKCPVRMAMVGQQDTFGESGKPDELKAKYGMTAADIVAAALAVK
ncbi:MAG: transketolase family protein [Firmicutes bacterium]|nr:transketolase family protein [Bacillota bacterium]